jgi:glycerate dehydrogenase
MKITVLDSFAVNPGDLSWDFLNKYGEATVYDKTPPELAAERCADAEAVFTNRAEITENAYKVPKSCIAARLAPIRMMTLPLA